MKTVSKMLSFTAAASLLAIALAPAFADLPADAETLVTNVETQAAGVGSFTYDVTLEHSANGAPFVKVFDAEVVRDANGHFFVEFLPNGDASKKRFLFNGPDGRGSFDSATGFAERFLEDPANPGQYHIRSELLFTHFKQFDVVNLMYGGSIAGTIRQDFARMFPNENEPVTLTTAGNDTTLLAGSLQWTHNSGGKYEAKSVDNAVDEGTVVTMSRSYTYGTGTIGSNGYPKLLTAEHYLLDDNTSISSTYKWTFSNYQQAPATWPANQFSIANINLPTGSQTAVVKHDGTGTIYLNENGTVGNVKLGDVYDSSRPSSAAPNSSSRRRSGRSTPAR